MTRQPDKAKIEKFAGTMMGVLNGGMLSLMTSIGYRTGLFDADSTLISKVLPLMPGVVRALD